MLWLSAAMTGQLAAQSDALRQEARASMRKAAQFYHEQAATRGGYVYYYSPDLAERWGEGRATADQIWVQPPGTPAVGMAFLRAFEATADAFYLRATEDAARALLHGQLVSGGWTNAVDFNPKGSQVAQYRNGQGRGKFFSTLDDGITQAALRFLMRLDHALGGKDKAVAEAAQTALDALLAAQFPNGGFPQGWTGPVEKRPVVKARYPDYDWRTENRIKNYWEHYTLNDGVCGHVAETLEEAWTLRRDARCREALAKLGDFLLLAQMPDPQPAWAQQYDTEMRPIWARKFEPPAIAGRESEDAMLTLIRIARVTREARYLEPLPAALAYLKKSLLPGGKLARYYELQSNKPLYMTADYQLTHNDRDVPKHYGWQNEARLAEIEAALAALRTGKPESAPPPPSEAEVREILRGLDTQGRWISRYDGAMLVGQPKFRVGAEFLSSAVFAGNLEALSRFVRP